ncbi:hypothetical protein [Fluviicola sp.]|uniref:hypothetical protein n=1 Tax=Fluviicola sp. TaxID=1917219 RepID=UPI003D2C107E
MKKIYFTIIIGFITLTSYSQVIADRQLNNFVDYLKRKNVSEEEINNMVSGLVENPDLYNNLWKNFIDQAIKGDNTKWKFLNDLNVQFKTFQATDNQPTALGLTYDFNIDYAKFSEKDSYRNSHSYGLTAKGNIAFRKNLNPTDFLETKVNYRWSQFFGGVIKSKDQITVFSRLNGLEDKLVNISDMQSKEAIALWNEFSKNLVLSNQYYYSLAPKFALESNQDFSKTQFTPGLTIDLSAKAWKKNNMLSYFNIFDYPFALIRLITGTDKKFTVYGSTIPTAQLGFDYVIPANDTMRKNLTGNLDPFPRIKFETSFRTFITRVKKENIFFSVNYRYYQELNTPETIIKANLGTHSYFVMALQTTSGFYVSYANGKLPFDAKSDEVYSIGFNYKFN